MTTIVMLPNLGEFVAGFYLSEDQAAPIDVTIGLSDFMKSLNCKRLCITTLDLDEHKFKAVCNKDAMVMKLPPSIVTKDWKTIVAGPVILFGSYTSSEGYDELCDLTPEEFNMIKDHLTIATMTKANGEQEDAYCIYGMEKMSSS